MCELGYVLSRFQLVCLRSSPRPVLKKSSVGDKSCLEARARLILGARMRLVTLVTCCLGAGWLPSGPCI